MNTLLEGKGIIPLAVVGVKTVKISNCSELGWRGVPSRTPCPSPMKGEGALITFVTPSGACPCALSMHKAPSPTRGEGLG